MKSVIELLGDQYPILEVEAKPVLKIPGYGMVTDWFLLASTRSLQLRGILF
jgi:hypothetical protein